MKKSQQKIALMISIILVSSIILSSISFVSAETRLEKIEKKVGSVGSLFEGVTLKDSEKIILAKWMLVFLLALVVYAISSAFPFFPENNYWIRWAFAIVVAVLGFLFVTPGDIQLLLTNYAALGIALTTIIPLVILITFTYELRKNKPDIATFINKPVIILFFIYLVISWLNFDSDKFSTTPYFEAAYWLTLVATLIWLIWERPLVKQAMKNETSAVIDNAKNTLRKATTNQRLNAGQLRDVAEEENA